jgi:hypothetical protein
MPPQPENVILLQRASFNIVYGGPTRAEGRSYNFTPVFFIYPDGKLDKSGAEQLLADLDIQPLLDANYGTAVVINPTAGKYDAKADFEVFAQLFNQFRGPGNLKVVGFGAGATFVNQVIAPQVGGQIADILRWAVSPARRWMPRASLPTWPGRVPPRWPSLIRLPSPPMPTSPC